MPNKTSSLPTIVMPSTCGLFIRGSVLSQTSLSNQIGVLLLCEVAVKPYLELTNAKYDAAAACKSSNHL